MWKPKNKNGLFCIHYQVAKFVKSRIWKEITRAVEFLSGKKGWYPYDVAMNIIRNSHYTRIHEDCEPHEVCMNHFSTECGLRDRT